MSNAPISSTMVENRRFAPSEAFAKDAHVQSLEAYQALYKRAEDDPDGYWAEQAQALRWLKPWKQVLDWQPPFAKWFVGGELNVSDNCLDRHLAAQGSVPSRADKPAIIFEGEPGDRRTISYKQLHEEVSRLANGLKKLGVGAGDRVAIYLPMIPEAAAAMLACSRIGATHTVIFGGFSSDALRDRVNDAGCKIIITADGGWRRGAIVPLKPQVDAARAQTPTVTHVIVVKRTKQPIETQPGDVDYHELLQSVSAECPPTPLESSHPLFILYTSGTTGKPKGVVHATGGYLVNAALTTKWVFDLKEKDVFFCTADVGWVTGHSYVVYGPLANGATVVMYEGAPNFPEPDRLWEIIDRHKVTIFYTAPTAIRSFIRWGDQWPNKHKLNTLRLLGSVGEPINPEAWMWYQRVIGKEHCPIVDTWWQTETGGIMCSPLPGATPTKPGSCTLPLPGVALDVVDKTGKSVAANEGGILVIKRPWPSMLTTLFNDNERYAKAYFGETFSSLGAEASKAIYVAGDGARRDADGYFWVMGRIDDVVNVSGHRLGTAEVESALVSHGKVAEAAVVGRNDELKGQALVAFVTLKQGVPSSEELKTELKNHVAKEIGSIAKPDEIRFADALPKTRSGKIMRRLLRELASGEKVKGDTSTLEDFSTLEKLRQDDE